MMKLWIMALVEGTPEAAEELHPLPARGQKESHLRPVNKINTKEIPVLLRRYFFHILTGCSQQCAGISFISR